MPPRGCMPVEMYAHGAVVAGSACSLLMRRPGLGHREYACALPLLGQTCPLADMAARVMTLLACLGPRLCPSGA